jgi:hypothetical protein
MEGVLASKSAIKNFSGYIMCLHRKNTPRISVKVCEQSCPFKSECKEYRIFFDDQSGKSRSVN